jgi:DNA polymerase III delta subunit
VKFVELKLSLKTKTALVYILFGEDIFLVSKAIELITASAGVLNDQLDISRLGEDATAEGIVAECRTVSFMGGNRVVVVKPAAEGQFTKTLGKYFESPATHCTLIMMLPVAKLSASIEQLAGVQLVDCNPMTPEIIVKLVIKQFADSGKVINAEDATLLMNYCGNSYTRINNEIKKLIGFCGDAVCVTRTDIEQMVTKTQEFQVYELANAVTKGDITVAEHIMQNLSASGVEDYALFGNLVSHLRRLYYSLSTKANNEVVASYLKCSPYAVNYARRDNKHLQGKIEGLYSSALEYEYQIKSGKISASSAVYNLMFKI